MKLELKIFAGLILTWVLRESGLPKWLSGERICLMLQEKKGMQIWSLDQEDPLEEEMATYSSILAWGNPWAEESGALQSIGSQKVRHD